ncbi:hypothetical protein XENOCAPTIV_019857 [Xenoophorus captivus]|uniref:Uncharacterized protein n=1 Tax=Xenoophorus captivus TaxID=1517983 RepID=A0ABV0S398_9TELE
MLSHMADLSRRAKQGSATAESGLSLVLFTSAGDKSFSHLRTHNLHTVSALHTGRGVLVCTHNIHYVMHADCCLLQSLETFLIT